MGQSVVLTGIVLNVMPIGEYDKRITLLTRERGKITAFARGARRPQSQLLAAANPFSFGEFEVFEGRNSYNVSKATIRNYFRELTEDLDATYMGFYFLEFADYFCQENNDEKEMLKLLYQSLRALSSPAYKKALVRAVFELKAVTINGEGPDMFFCMHCHSKENLHIFSVKKGGMLCEMCRDAAIGRRILDDTRYTMQYIISSTVEKLYSFSVSDEVLKELTEIMEEYLKHYVHHTFNSAAFLLK
ncbi:MAG: DNA repair protein RecO [Lachnospiraceae bacterium]